MLLAELSGCLTGSGPPAPKSSSASGTGGLGPADGLHPSTAEGAHSPVRPILLLAVRPGGAGKASSGLSLGVNASLKFLKIAGLKLPGQMFGSVGSPTTVTSRVQRELWDSAHYGHAVRC